MWCKISIKIIYELSVTKIYNVDVKLCHYCKISVNSKYNFFFNIRTADCKISVIAILRPNSVFFHCSVTLGAPAGLPREDSSLATANQLSMTNVTEYRYQVIYQPRDQRIFSCLRKVNRISGKFDFFHAAKNFLGTWNQKEF